MHARLPGRRRNRPLPKVVSLIVALAAAAATVALPSSAHATGLLYPVDQHPARASSVEGPAFVAQNAADRSATTRWSSAFRDNQWLDVDLGVVAPINSIELVWEAAYAKTFKIQVSNDGISFRDATPVLNGPDGSVTSSTNHYPQTATPYVSARYVRILGLTRATNYGFSLWEVNVAYLSFLGRCETEFARNKPATASSVESVSTPASAAFDGNPSTRWSSSFSDQQWLQVDLGSDKPVCTVRLNWEAAYAKTFVIQGSLDGVTFTDISRVTSGYDGFQSVGVNGTWRYVRLVGLTRATGYGFSLWEMSVVGDPAVCSGSVPC